MFWYKCMQCGEILNERDEFKKKKLPYMKADGTASSVEVDCCPRCGGGLEGFSEDRDEPDDEGNEVEEDDD